MKAIIRFSNIKKTSLLILAMLLLISCSTDDDSPFEPEKAAPPPITLTVTDCPVEAIEITPDVKLRKGGSSRWILEVKVNITCMGEVVDKAELKIDYSWLSKDFKIKTDKNGDAKHRQMIPLTGRPSGSVTITIEGSDGTKPLKVPFS